MLEQGLYTLNTTNHSKKICIGLIIDSQEIPAWQLLMIEKIQQLKLTEIILAVQNYPAKYKGLSLYHGIINLDLKVRNVNPYALSRKSLKILLPDIEIIKLGHLKAQGEVVISESEYTRINGFGINLWIQLASGNFGNSLFVNADFGIWRFEDFDKNYLSIVQGFWEVLNGKPMIESILSVQTKTQNSIVYKSYSSVWSLYVNQTINPHYWKASSFIPRKLADLISLGKRDFFASISGIDNRNEFLPHKTPETLKLIWPTIKHSARFMADKLNKRLFKRKWILMYSVSPTENNSFGDFKWLLPPKDRHWADPFIIYQNNKYYIYFEEFGPTMSDKGHISLITLDEQGSISSPVIVLQRPYHLSYPFIFYWEDAYYMVPETSENKAIELYKCICFPDQWEYQYDLMTKIDAYDSTIVEYKQKWWLFANIKENKGASSWDELSVYYSDSPISQNWRPHPKNPVISDACKARPAGKLYIENGVLFRPSQNCAMHYGYGLKINKVLTLTTEEYTEQEEISYEPNWNSKIKGLHTINKTAKATIIDALLEE